MATRLNCIRALSPDTTPRLYANKFLWEYRGGYFIPFHGVRVMREGAIPREVVRRAREDPGPDCPPGNASNRQADVKLVNI